MMTHTKTLMVLTTALSMGGLPTSGAARAGQAYDDHMCAQLAPIAKELKQLHDAEAIKRYSESEFGQLKWQPSLSTLWALKDKLRARTVGLSDGEPTGLGYFLTHSARPSETGVDNPYVEISKELSTSLDGGGAAAPASYEMELARRIVASKGDLRPAQVFRMAVETTGGDLPLGMLVAHNLLKEAAYARRTGQLAVLGQAPNKQGRKAKDHYRKAFGVKGGVALDDGKGTVFTLAPDLVRAKLHNLRPSFDTGAKDDVLGPWYHAFGVLFYGSTAATGRYGAGFLAGVENITRYVGIGSGRSLSKEALNRCAAKTVGRMNDLEKAYDAKLVAKKQKAAGIKFRGRLVEIRNTVEAYEWGKTIGRQARSGGGGAGEIRALVREIYGQYPKGSKLRDAFRRGYVAGSQ